MSGETFDTALLYILIIDEVGLRLLEQLLMSLKLKSKLIFHSV